MRMSEPSLSERILLLKPVCSDPKALEDFAAEVAELERDKMGAEYNEGLVIAELDEAKKRAEAAEALLTEAPNPGYGQNAQRWTDEEYWPWWKRIRAAVGKT